MIFIWGLLAFVFLGCSCLEFLMIKHLIFKNQEMRCFLIRYEAQMGTLILINRDLQQKLNELRNQS